MAAAKLDTILLLGDSLTQGGWEPNGFAQRLAYVYARKFDVVNRGLSGYNTEWAIPCLEQSLVPAAVRDDHPKIRLFLIWFGANDSCILPSPQHVPLEKFKQNLERIIDTVKSPDSKYYSPEAQVLLLTPPPVDTIQRAADLRARDPPRELDRLFDNTKAYSEAVKAVAASKGTILVDIWTAIWDAAGQKEEALPPFLSDGLHLTAEGYGIVYEKIILAIKESASHLHYENLQPVFPPWDTINWEDPVQSLHARNAIL